MQVKTHSFGSTGEAYNASQTSDEIHDGDVLVVASERVVGVMVKAWPVAVTAETGEFHALDPEVDWASITDDVDERDYSASVAVAREEIAKFGARQILIHLSVMAPASDTRSPDQIADAVLAAFMVGQDDPNARDLWVVPKLAEEEIASRGFKVGDRVRFKHDVDRYPHFVVEAGKTGTVNEVSAELFSVRMDEDFEGGEEWDMDVHWYPVNGDMPEVDLVRFEEVSR